MSEQDEIVEVKGVPLIVKGGDRDITVKISELEYCITAIRKLKEYKASLMLEQIVARGSTPPAAPVRVTEKMIDAAARVLNKRLAEGNGLHGVSRDMLEAALSASPSPVDSREGLDPQQYRAVHDAAIAAYAENTPPDHRYSATALRKAVDAALLAAKELHLHPSPPLQRSRRG